MRTDDFDFDFPPELIAKQPLPRGESRLAVVKRQDRITSLAHSDSLPIFAQSPALPGMAMAENPVAAWGGIADLPSWLKPGDALVLNDTRVLRARLFGRDAQGREVEALLLKPLNPAIPEMASTHCHWEAMVKPGKRFRPGHSLIFGPRRGETEAEALVAEVVAIKEDGLRVLRLAAPSEAIPGLLDRLGEIPLPPYIDRAANSADAENYQSVFARNPGSVAAPTASLHFTEAMLDALRSLGVETVTVTLHVGAGTFKPVETETAESHAMHGETYVLGEEQARRLNAIRARGGRLIAVGTTAARVLESCATGPGHALVAGQGETRLFVLPGYAWKAVDGLLTNFHWPRSTLFMLVSSLLGVDNAKSVYAQAMARGYRLFSYGDAMLIL